MKLGMSEPSQADSDHHGTDIQQEIHARHREQTGREDVGGVGHQASDRAFKGLSASRCSLSPSEGRTKQSIVRNSSVVPGPHKHFTRETDR